ncbi:surface-adhesin E family protein [Geomonas subterranea]|uniref:surface-adhesin E family protein n=1 Tax=Geomonas subterranea TaxID=2847989 RepID=UPI001CD63AD1|nr:surface-adhesin E family protein [Geomonas fuzhouensis]
MRWNTFHLTLCAISLLWTAQACCAPADWYLLDENRDSSFFVDRSGINRVREGVIQVRTRVVYSDLGKNEAAKILKGLQSPAALYETLYSYEINCVEREGHLLAASHFDKGGVLLKSSDLDAATQWEYLPPDTRMGLVLQQACPH